MMEKISHQFPKTGGDCGFPSFQPRFPLFEYFDFPASIAVSQNAGLQRNDFQRIDSSSYSFLPQPSLLTRRSIYLCNYKFCQNIFAFAVIPMPRLERLRCDDVCFNVPHGRIFSLRLPIRFRPSN